MGWFESEAGWNGDEPADAFGGAVQAIRSVQGTLPTVEEVVGSLVAALNCDGRCEPLFKGKHLVAALKIRHGDATVRISTDVARPDVVGLMYDALDVASEAYRESVGRPPSVAEILQYIDVYLRPEESDEFVRNPRPWKLAAATVVRSKKLKPADRSPCLAAETADPSPKLRATHRKFGPGLVTRELDTAVEVLFEDGQRRLIQRAFLEVLVEGEE